MADWLLALLLMQAPAGDAPADEAPVDLEFLEYLGSWEDDDSEWQLVEEMNGIEVTAEIEPPATDEQTESGEDEDET